MCFIFCLIVLALIFVDFAIYLMTNRHADYYKDALRTQSVMLIHFKTLENELLIRNNKMRSNARGTRLALTYSRDRH